jgi:hypothetical protein
MNALQNLHGKNPLPEAQLIYFNGHEKRRLLQIVLIAAAFLSIGLRANSGDGPLTRAQNISEVSATGSLIFDRAFYHQAAF